LLVDSDDRRMIPEANVTASKAKQATDGLLADYERLVDKVDQHSARVTAAHSAAIACAGACTGCCHRELSVFPVEASAIRGWLGETRLPAVQAPRPEAHALSILELGPTPDPCVMLSDEGLCRIYPVRPLICRTHGLPLAVADEEGLYADICPLSFDGGAGLAELEQDDFLVVDTLNSILAAVNAAYVAATGASPERVVLRAIAAGN
jgi:uncharacterized protein